MITSPRGLVCSAVSVEAVGAVAAASLLAAGEVASLA
jgi:uncharacterized protein YsxB (DUF464 family)